MIGSSRKCAGFAVVAVAAIQLVAGGSVAGAAESPPNLLVILADDLGWRDVGWNGSEIRTPNLDRIASAGLQLNRFYAQPSCSPTRAALMTGKSPLRLGIVRPFSKNGGGALPIGERLLPQYFKDAGYQTFMTGKWHLGHAEKRFFPQTRGFDHFYGHVTGGIGYWDHTHGGGLDWQRNGETLRETGYSTDLITNEALSLIQARDPAKPMLLYVAYNAPHLPNEAPAESVAAYAEIESPYRRVHAAMVSELDRGIGKLVEALEAAGILDDTLIFFASDNGGISLAGQPPEAVSIFERLVSILGEPLPLEALEFLRVNTLEGGSDNLPLRGAKMAVEEGGTRVPAAIWWPGRVEGGRLDTFISMEDVLPTLLDAAGLAQAIPSDLDGTSRLPQLLGEPDTPAPRDFVTVGVAGEALYRPPWKLLQPAATSPFSATPAAQLYRVDLDPSETRDLAAENPERVAAMSEALVDWPRGPEVHGLVLGMLWDPDRFGGNEDRAPWADVAR